VQQGVETEKARKIVKLIKDAKLKVQVQIQATNCGFRQEARRPPDRDRNAAGAGF
jgi:uncharacterized protein YajQ (UPF0234 family)